ncbi:hypothetical protein [Lacticaseibacillus zhaodongensis]|uniref:hypothetical protein n=1 Tax=Lacticaseibacillus zhaodongensis TaxID=2668065 RepID=UPI0012D31C0C|nr:hypothetical protein [Lacticaseibacillus zhaodongensis]
MAEIKSKWRVVRRTNDHRHFAILETTCERLKLTKRAPNAANLHEIDEKIDKYIDAMQYLADK